VYFQSKMSISKWWGRMKDTYGDLSPKEAFMAGKSDGKNLTMQVKVNKLANRAEKKRRRREIKQRIKI